MSELTVKVVGTLLKWLEATSKLPTHKQGAMGQGAAAVFRKALEVKLLRLDRVVAAAKTVADNAAAQQFPSEDAVGHYAVDADNMAELYEALAALEVSGDAQ